MSPRRLLALLFAAALPLPLAGAGGCAEPTTMAAGAGISAVEFGVSTYIKGRLEAAELASMDQAHASVLHTLTDLDFKDIGERRAANGRWTELTTEDRQGRTITIRCSAISPDVTKIKIRVGLWGDQAVSSTIHQQVREHLFRLTAAGISVRDDDPGDRSEAPAPDDQRSEASTSARQKP